MSRSRFVVMRVQPDIDGLIKRALRSGRYAGVSSYLRTLIVEERKKAGDPKAAVVSPNVPLGRRRAA